MNKLYKTVCHTGRKGRPNHQLELVAESDDHETLIQAQNKDVIAWQQDWLKEELAIRKNYDENELEDPTIPTQWARANLRFEMDRKEDETMREFAESFEDGGFWSLVYHIVE